MGDSGVLGIAHWSRYEADVLVATAVLGSPSLSWWAVMIFWETTHFNLGVVIGVRLVTSDAHARLVEATCANLPGTSWQRCRTHYATNLMSVPPKSMWPAVKAMLHSVDDQPDAASVEAQFDRLLDYTAEKLPTVSNPTTGEVTEPLTLTA